MNGLKQRDKSQYCLLGWEPIVEMVNEGKARMNSRKFAQELSKAFH